MLTHAPKVKVIPQQAEVTQGIPGRLTFRSLTTYMYIYIHTYIEYTYLSYRSANLQTLHFKYLFNKYTYRIF